MKRFITGFGWLVAACVAVAGTGTSNEFRVDTRTGVRTAAATEKIQYSTAWVTNLTAAQKGEAKAVVKVNPCLKTPPKYLVVDMSGGRSAARWPISYLDEVPSGGWTDEYKTEKLVLRYIPAGSFIMGGRATDYPGAVNANLHMVTLTKPFYIGVFECTQRQWELAMGTRPSWFSNETYYAARPVERVSYQDIRGSQKGIAWPDQKGVDEDGFMWMLRQKTASYSFDLPTEAQWEYACRAGTATALSTGENLSDMTNSIEVVRLARYAFNSGWATDVYWSLADGYKWTDANCSTDKGTAKVGSYQVNSWGLYDMEGNVAEICLDVYTNTLTECVDPVGPSSSISDRRLYRGGSWRFLAASSVSGDRKRADLGYYSRAFSCGFRICLHDADFPSLESAAVLVDASGAGAADWTPTQAGTYQLTHEVQVDGTTVAPMESALFRVEGPELNIRPQGELTNGVEVAIEGAGDWPVYYTTDGSTPTQASEHYEGPFAIPESATVKTVAISAGGVSSEVASKELALSPALAVEDTKARQRYPWNGKVDIDCEIIGDATKKYRVGFSVEDEIGHTNLPIRTVTPEDRVLPPGKYRFTWDAAADLPKGTRFGGVSVSIDAEPSPMADWKRVVTISTDGYVGNETLTDVPVLVRLSSAIEGFDYADFAAPDTGVDMIFTDMEGTARYPYEIDEWHKDGESLVWVKLPELKKGTKFKLAYGNAQYAIEQSNNPNNRTIATHSVWREYAGVWHMNEDSGTAFDSTEHGLDALPSCGTNKLADVSQMVAYENGACGRARVNAPKALTAGNSLEVPSYDALSIAGDFVVSGWFYGADANQNARLWCRKKFYMDQDGWEVQVYGNNSGRLCARGAGGGNVANDHDPNFYIPKIESGWVYVVVSYAAQSVVGYTNGVLSVTQWNDIPTATDNGLTLGIGGSKETCSFGGQYDEIRLRGGTLSADRIKADYDMIANRDFCTYGKVEAGPGAEPVPPSTTYRVRFNANGGTGMMADEVFEIGVAKALTANAFTRDGYAFEGWATSAGGAKVYADKQSVSDLTTKPGATVNLYAVWKQLGGVQLWEGGPYWAECNVGATKPEEPGYYFWWGDTVGYKRNAAGDGWISVDGKNASIAFSSGDTTAKQTYGHDNAWLTQNGWIGEDGNLVVSDDAAKNRDAARAHLGAPWRMMTKAELDKLVDASYCTRTWVTSYNGKSVSGYVVKGAKDPYKDNEVFFPAAGYGYVSTLRSAGSDGDYWSSTPDAGNSDYAWGLNFYSSNFDADDYGVRCLGQSVRPVRDAAQ